MGETASATAATSAAVAVPLSDVPLATAVPMPDRMPAVMTVTKPATPIPNVSRAIVAARIAAAAPSNSCGAPKSTRRCVEPTPVAPATAANAIANDADTSAAPRRNCRSAAATTSSTTAVTPAATALAVQLGPVNTMHSRAIPSTTDAKQTAATPVLWSCQRAVRARTPVATASRTSSNAISGSWVVRVRRCSTSPSRIWLAASVADGSSGGSDERCSTQPPCAAPSSATSAPRLDTRLASSSATGICIGTARSARRPAEITVIRQVFETTLEVKALPWAAIGLGVMRSLGSRKSP